MTRHDRPLHLALLGAAVLAGCATTHETPMSRLRHTGLDQAIDRVEVDLQIGAVEVRVGPSTAVDEESRYSDEAPRVDLSVEGGTLRLEGTCSPQRVCWSNLVLTVPPEVAVTAQTGVGALRVAGVEGDLVLETGVGAIRVDDTRGDLLVLDSGSGELEGYGLQASTVYAHTGAGTVTLDLRGPIADVVVETGAGPVDLAVPAGGYRLDLYTGQGTVTTVGVSDVAAGPTLSARTGTGDVVVTGE